ncbi:glucuronate isomerase, partial [Streptococcus suis]
FTAISYEEASLDELDDILLARLAGKEAGQSSINNWQTAIFRELCRLYKKHGFVTQFHFGALRNNHTGQLEKLGADVGVDS